MWGVPLLLTKAACTSLAVEKLTSSYEHIDPSTVGNTVRLSCRNYPAGAISVCSPPDLGIRVAGNEQAVLEQVKEMEGRGFQFEKCGGNGGINDAPP